MSAVAEQFAPEGSTEFLLWDDGPVLVSRGIRFLHLPGRLRITLADGRAIEIDTPAACCRVTIAPVQPGEPVRAMGFGRQFVQRLADDLRFGNPKSEIRNPQSPAPLVRLGQGDYIRDIHESDV